MTANYPLLPDCRPDTDGPQSTRSGHSPGRVLSRRADALYPTVRNTRRDRLSRVKADLRRGSWISGATEGNRMARHSRGPWAGCGEAHAFISRFNSLRNCQSVPSAMIFWGLDLIIPASCNRSA